MIFRPSTITGTANLKDFSNLLMRGTVLLGAYPSGLGHTNVIPVEFCAQAIAALSLAAASYAPSSGLFHLLNPANLAFDALFAALRSYGYPLAPLPLDAFRDRLAAAPANPLFPLLNQFAGLHGRSPPSLPATLQWMQAQGLSFPPTGEQLFHGYLATFVKDGLLPAPPQREDKE